MTYWPAQFHFLIDADTCIESKGSGSLPGAVEKESALTNGSSCSSSVLSEGLETGLVELDEAEGDRCGELCCP